MEQTTRDLIQAQGLKVLYIAKQMGESASDLSRALRLEPKIAELRKELLSNQNTSV